MARRTKDPDFRYVWLVPGPPPAAIAIGAGIIGLAALAVGLWSAGYQPISFGLTLGVSLALALTFARAERRLPSRGAREVPMAIVPWGIVVTPDSEPRVLRWPAIRKISVDVTHTMRGGTPSVVASLVTVRTDREVLAGRTAGSVDLERLLVSLDAYAEEASKPIAVDIDGTEAAGDGSTEPVVGDVESRARALCQSVEGAARLRLPASDYRSLASRSATPETVAVLRAILESDADAAADPRPLAAMIVGLLHAVDLVPVLLRLVSSPHPVVAAVAKATALRLGAPRNRAGSVDEVASFLFEEDCERLRRWAEP